LREQRLPDEATWNAARERAAKLFGLAPPALITANSVSLLVEALKARADELRAPAAGLVRTLETRLRTLGIEPEKAQRMRTARALGACAPGNLGRDLLPSAASRVGASKAGRAGASPVSGGYELC